MISVAVGFGAAAFAELPEPLQLDPRQFFGIPLALIGAALLSFGAQYQSRGLNKVERITGESAGAGLSIKHVIRLFQRPSWVIGTLFLGLATVFQIWALALSPLIVVQPIGVVALVLTAVLNSRFSGVRLGPSALIAIAMCVSGIVVFVTIAAFNAVDKPVTDTKLLTILITFAIVFLITLVLFLMLRKRAIALLYIVGAGVLYGFVATLAKTVISRFQQGEVEWITWLCVAALILGTVMGMQFLQNAYSSGPPDLVVAGLTVVDPLVAVLIGIIVLGEASQSPPWAVLIYVISAIVAIMGVWGLAKYHPQTGMSVVLKNPTGSIRVIRDRGIE